MADVGGRQLVEFGRDGERADAVSELGGGRVFALTGGDEESELVEHVMDGFGVAVVPLDDALGGVAAADEPELSGGSIGGADLASDFDEQAAVGHADIVVGEGTRGLKHGEAVIERKLRPISCAGVYAG